MQRKNIIITTLIIVTTISMTSITLTQGIILLADSVDDVVKYSNGIFVKKGNFRDEIDITSLTFKVDRIALNLQANPMIDNYHSYEVVIVWSNITIHQNKTEITFGKVGNDPFVDVISYTVVNATGHSLSIQPEPVYNSTQARSNKLEWRVNVGIYAYEHMINPHYVNATTKYVTTEGSDSILYLDSHLIGEIPPTPGAGIIWNLSTVLSILGTILVSTFAGYTVGQISVYFLTTNIRSKQNNTFFMAAFVLGLAVLVNYWFWLTPWQIFWTVGAFFLAIAFGYIWAARGVMRLKFDSPLPDNLPIDTEDKLGALIVLSKGEAEEYNPLALVRKYYKNLELGVKQRGKYLQPFEFFKVKQKYQKMFKDQVRMAGNTIKMSEAKNPYREISKDIIKKLEESFLDFDMYTNAYVNDWPTINQTLLTALSRGANRITILNLFTSENFDYHLALEEMKRIDYSKIDITISQTDFYAKNESIQNYIVQKILKKISKEMNKETIGIMLVAEGQPSEWDSIFPLTENEIIFRTSIQKKLIAKGFNERNIKYAWIENHSPSIQESFEELVDNGCNTIISVAVSTPIDCINSLYDIKETVAKLAAGKDLQVLSVNGWNLDEEIIKIYLAVITAAKPMPLEELGKDAEIVLHQTKAKAKIADIDEEKESSEK